LFSGSLFFAKMIPRDSIRRGSHVIDALRSGALGISRLAPFASRDFRANDRDSNIEEEEGEESHSVLNKSDSAMSMSSSSSGEDLMNDSKRRQSKVLGGVSQSMMKLNKDGDKAARRSKYIIMGVLLVIGSVVLILTSVMLNQEKYNDFVNGVSCYFFLYSFCGVASNLRCTVIIAIRNSLKTWL
jgi:hypothetical protein